MEPSLKAFCILHLKGIASESSGPAYCKHQVLFISAPQAEPPAPLPTRTTQWKSIKNIALLWALFRCCFLFGSVCPIVCVDIGVWLISGHTQRPSRHEKCCITTRNHRGKNKISNCSGWQQLWQIWRLLRWGRGLYKNASQQIRFNKRLTSYLPFCPIEMGRYTRYFWGIGAKGGWGISLSGDPICMEMTLPVVGFPLSALPSPSVWAFRWVPLGLDLVLGLAKIYGNRSICCS